MLSSRFHVIFLQLREIWVDLISKSTRKDGKLNFDAFTWLNKVTLDIIGLAGDFSPCSIPPKRRSHRSLCASQDLITTSTRYAPLMKSKMNFTSLFVPCLELQAATSCSFSSYSSLSSDPS